LRLRSNGARHYYEQCLTCGLSVGMALKKSPEFANAPAWNESQEDQYRASREAEHADIIQKHVRKQKSGTDGFKREYERYLDSPEWKAKRARVLDRAKGTCEGCLEKTATQVHHPTYKHIKCEFMFELIAVCDGCHARLHDDNTRDESENSEWTNGYSCAPADGQARNVDGDGVPL
jgi:hypothetical protein